LNASENIETKLDEPMTFGHGFDAIEAESNGGEAKSPQPAR
jgi:hypothetical protein